MVSPTSGTVMAGPFGSTAATLGPFTVTIDPGVPPGTVALFDISFTDGCNGLAYPTDFQRFEVRATTGLRVVPQAPVVPVVDAGPVTVTWRISNPTASPITKAYTFGSIPDPESQEQLNNGTVYFIKNALPADKSPAGGGGSVTLAPGAFQDI